MTGQICSNCRKTVHGRFCSECGQHQVALDRPIRTLVPDIWALLRPWEARIATTIRALMLLPGTYANDWLSGRQMGYSSPLKLFATLVFVLAALLKFTDFRLLQIHVAEPVSFAAGVKPHYDCTFPQMQCVAVGGTGILALRSFDIQQAEHGPDSFVLPLETSGKKDPDAAEISEVISKAVRDSSFINANFAEVLGQILTYSLPATFMALLLLLIGRRKHLVSHAIHAVAIQSAIYAIGVLAVVIVWASRGAIHGFWVPSLACALLTIYMHAYFRQGYGLSRRRSAISAAGFVLLATLFLIAILLLAGEVTNWLPEVEVAATLQD